MTHHGLQNDISAARERIKPLPTAFCRWFESAAPAWCDLQPQVEFPDPISACYLSDVFRTAAQLHTSLRHDRCPIKGGRVLLWYQTSQFQYLDRTILALPAERNLAESQSKCHVAVACSEERIFDLLCTQIQVLVRNLTSWPYWPAQAGK